MKRLAIIDSVQAESSRADRMWEKLLEIVMFFRERKHRKPVEILKGFISSRTSPQARLTAKEIRTLRLAFHFLRESYTHTALGASRLATDQTHFYTMITALEDSGLLARYGESALRQKLVRFGEILDTKIPVPDSRKLRNLVKGYQDITAKQTTDSSRRMIRGQVFSQIIAEL